MTTNQTTNADIRPSSFVLLFLQSFDALSLVRRSGSFRKLEKFESSTYSEVLKAIDLHDNNKPVVMKIMRALSRGVIKKLPPVTTKGCQSYNDILNELVVTQALNKLHDGVTLTGGKSSAIYKTPFFCLIHEIKVVSGNLERTLSKSQAASSNLPARSANNLMKGHDENKGTVTKNPQLAQAVVQPLTNRDQHQTGTNKNESSSSSSRHVSNKIDIKDEELRDLSEEDRMLMEALPYEYVVSVMRHDGQPLWWMMTHKKLSAEQLTSVLVQVIVGLAIAEKVYSYEHRDLHVSNILIKKTSRGNIPFTLDGNKYNIVSYGIKATIIDATFSRLTQNGKVYYRDLTSTLRAYGSKKTPSKMSLQNNSYRQMVQMTKNNWQEFTPKTNLVWLTYLCETLIKNDVMKSNPKLLVEIKKIKDFTLKVSTTLDLLSFFPFDKEKKNSTRTNSVPRAPNNRSSMSRVSGNDKGTSTISTHKNDKQ